MRNSSNNRVPLNRLRPFTPGRQTLHRPWSGSSNWPGSRAILTASSNCCRGSSFAEEDREAALMAGDYQLSLARDMAEGEARTAALKATLVHYRLATTISSGRDIFMARGMSRIADLYIEFPEIAPDVWEDELRVLLLLASLGVLLSILLRSPLPQPFFHARLGCEGRSRSSSPTRTASTGPLPDAPWHARRARVELEGCYGRRRRRRGAGSSRRRSPRRARATWVSTSPRTPCPRCAGARPHVAVGERLPFADGSVDVVLSAQRLGARPRPRG